MRAECYCRPVHGFTLLEVLVAMAIVAFALTGLVGITTTSLENRQQLEDRSLALWVAQNRVVSLRLAKAWPPTGRQSGKSSMGGRNWNWLQTVESTADAKVRKLQLQVFNEQQQASALLTAFLVRTETRE